MKSLQSHSTHWRATCSYPTHGVDFRDYVRGNFAGFWQKKEVWGLHIDSSFAGCQFNPSSGSVATEDNFGMYWATNPKFRCCKDDQSTTQWWFGAHL
ncbi:uncharacterized protein LOC122953648 [Acropora millepora]|uniref:uncharacterized protein LOC122953648 n=1 Tax=Acropora millepora TaxID=45264 RepID=UPI001CF49089|nr:uncharacterized protein LOC122953648 [Acropora millepora]